MLAPQRTKYRKLHRFRGALSGVASRGARLAFGQYGLKSLSNGELSSRQIEAARKTIAHALKRGGKTWIRIFPHIAITRKANEVPMGSGKGSVEFYVSPVKPGTILFEMDGIPEAEAKEALRLAGSKLPIKTRFVKSLRS
ncbi:MAG: 50S ribosomal protein L16 [Candidatus Peregrinibacteria bacterium GW2011_GWA2_47_7]|nr:MAG: 50S ribosomal protein L16 [Candidatus Peregrinibacteria bacterium GW2011_GWA2_47_7]